MSDSASIREDSAERGDAKLAFLQSDGVALAFEAGVGGGYGESSDRGFEESTVESHYWADANLLLAVRLAPSTDLNVASRFLQGEMYTRHVDGDTARYSTQYDAIGGALGVSFRRDGYAVSPELAVYQMKARDTESDFRSEPALLVIPTLGFAMGF